MQYFITWHIIIALVQLTNGNETSDGLLEILYQGEWYTTCDQGDYFYRSYNNHGEVVCKELGYDEVVAFGRRRKLSTEHRYQLWSYDLYCEGTEDSIYDCVSRYNNDKLSYSYCSYIAEYSCQSMYTVEKFHCKVVHTMHKWDGKNNYMTRYNMTKSYYHQSHSHGEAKI